MFVDAREEVLVVHENGTKNSVVRHGVAAAHAGGGHAGGGAHGGGAGGDAGVVIPVYAGTGGHRSPRNQHGRNNCGHNSTSLPLLVSTIFALVLLLTYCY